MIFFFVSGVQQFIIYFLYCALQFSLLLLFITELNFELALRLGGQFGYCYASPFLAQKSGFFLNLKKMADYIFFKASKMQRNIGLFSHLGFLKVILSGFSKISCI